MWMILLKSWYVDFFSSSSSELVFAVLTMI